MSLDPPQARDALYRALETAAAAVAVYDAALASAPHSGLRDEWGRQREAKAAHERELASALRSLPLDPDVQTASRHVVRQLGQSLAMAIRMAAQSETPSLAELIAVECAVHVETSCRHHWSLVARVARAWPGDAAAPLRRLAHDLELEQEEHIERAERWLSRRSLDAVGLATLAPPRVPVPEPLASIALRVPSSPLAEAPPRRVADAARRLA